MLWVEYQLLIVTCEHRSIRIGTNHCLLASGCHEEKASAVAQTLYKSCPWNFSCGLRQNNSFKKSHLCKIKITIFVCNLYSAYEILIVKLQQQQNHSLLIQRLQHTEIQICIGSRVISVGEILSTWKWQRGQLLSQHPWLSPLKISSNFFMGNCQESQWYKFCLQRYSHERAVGTSRSILFLCFSARTCSRFCPFLHARPCGERKITQDNFFWYCFNVLWFLFVCLIFS